MCCPTICQYCRASISEDPSSVSHPYMCSYNVQCRRAVLRLLWRRSQSHRLEYSASFNMFAIASYTNLGVTQTDVFPLFLSNAWDGCYLSKTQSDQLGSNGGLVLLQQ